MTGAAHEGPPARRAGGFRITWVPGSDRLHGICHCGADRVSEDPAELWTWLYDHPVDHRPTPEPAGDASPERSRALVPTPVGIAP
ncbi:hypothetical protein Acsp03_00700 [Actinomadura sp. NBRC 104412]|uniref:hypothetical protein n=1 Tax=Actinomadura sp. NBRC 104412 TaxID=3032203 RepID=UPI0024A574BC|nr:hypothetical protein [Actinomadura sp. NBRC 104412]GLZ02603.1 hypothetical protein Acsp03_00700 [Actinomadura sp. NBRC 104412]